ACLSREEVDHIIEEHGLPRHNDNTICSRRRLMQELKLAAQRGYSVDDEEDELGLRCIGAPVFWPDNRVVASISIAGTTAQVTPENLRDLAERVIRTALSISQALGHDPAALQESPWPNALSAPQEQIGAGSRISSAQPYQPLRFPWALEALIWVHDKNVVELTRLSCYATAVPRSPQTGR
ncbi:MAG: IclR family transcriptional regulator, partial [Terriglobia bacterium]